MTRDELHKAGLVYIQRSEISEEAGRIGSRLVSSWPVVRRD